MKPTDSIVKEGLSGLKPQLQSWPLSLEMVSELLLAALLPLPEPLDSSWIVNRRYSRPRSCRPRR